MEQNTIVNDDLPMRILTDSVRIKPDVQSISGNTVTFTDGSKVTDVDVIIKATGFVYGFPFMSEEIIKVENNSIELFGYMWPATVCKKHATIALIGFIAQAGAINPAVELQCRWATRVFQKHAKLPSEAEMWKAIREQQSRQLSNYLKSGRHSMKVEYIPYLDYLSSFIGCKPNISEYNVDLPMLICIVRSQSLEYF